MAERNHACPHCERAPGERHEARCPRSSKRMRARALMRGPYWYPRGTRGRDQEAWEQVLSQQRAIRREQHERLGRAR